MAPIQQGLTPQCWSINSFLDCSQGLNNIYNILIMRQGDNVRTYSLTIKYRDRRNDTTPAAGCER